MMTIYLTAFILISGLFLIPKSLFLQKTLIVITLVGQSSFCVYSYLHINETSSTYFSFDALGILLTGVLSILSFATFYHSLDYFKKANDSAKKISIYCLYSSVS